MDLFLKKNLKGEQYKKIFLTKEGSSRQYIRIQQNKSSWILACSPLIQQKKFLLRHKDFLSAGLNSLYIKSKNTKKGFLLLEDLGDKDLETQVFNNIEFPFVDYYSALDQIIKLQNVKQDTQEYKNLPVFTHKDFFKEILFTDKYLIKELFNIKLDNNFKTEYLKELNSICKQLMGFSYKFTHRDFHSRNIFIKNKKVYLIDFQDAALFPRFYDVVSLLYDVYVDPKITNSYREKLLNYFLLKSSFLEHTITRPITRSITTRPMPIPIPIQLEVTLTALQRLFKACGSFASFYVLNKQETHLKYIYPALKLLESLLQTQDIHYPYFLKLIKQLLQKKRI